MMSWINSISIDKLLRLIGTPGCLIVVDIRAAEDTANDPSLVRGSVQRSHETVQNWALKLLHSAAVVVCRQGPKLSHGVAALLRAVCVADAFMEAIHWDVAVMLYERYSNER
jgi:hypothetical protein